MVKVTPNEWGFVLKVENHSYCLFLQGTIQEKQTEGQKKVKYQQTRVLSADLDYSKQLQGVYVFF